MAKALRDIGLLALALVVGACGGNPSQTEQTGADTARPRAAEPAVLRPLVQITNPSFAAFVEQFPVATLPLSTANDSTGTAGSSLFADPGQARPYFLPDSRWPGMVQVSVYRRLPDYGNFVALVYASVQQESGGMLLTLVTYSPDGKPLAELALKDDADSGGYEAFFQDAVISPGMAIELTRTVIKYSGEGENYREASRTPTLSRYQLSGEGKIEPQP
jgi:hypothetical protein